MSGIVVAGLLAAAAPADAGAAVDLLFPRPDSPPARLRVAVAGDADPSPEAAWADFLDRLFDHFDRDGNRSLSPEEAGRVFPLPLPGGKQIAPDFAAFDADRDGKATPAEFRAFYRQAGFAPVVVVPRPPARNDGRLAIAAFRHLDRDGDGKLSAVELANAPKLIRRLDEDEDETVSAAEVLATGPVPDPPADGAAWPEPAPLARAEPDAILTVPLAPGGTPSLTPRNDAIHTLAIPGGNRLRFAVPGGDCGVAAPPADPLAGVREARRFLSAQFRTAVGRSASLTRADADGDPNLSALAGLFAAADRDGDNRLTAIELEAFLNLVECGASCQVVVAAADRGRNPFERLDADGNGRLDARELAATGDAIKPGESVPRRAVLTAARGPVGPTFGPVALGTGRPPTRAPDAKKPTGPDWLQAMDANGDGSVSAAEFVGPPDLFRRLDADGDGRIGAVEAIRTGR